MEYFRMEFMEGTEVFISVLEILSFQTTYGAANHGK